MLYKNGSSDADVTDKEAATEREKEMKKRKKKLYGETPPYVPLKTTNYLRKFGLVLQLVQVSKLVF